MSEQREQQPVAAGTNAQDRRALVRRRSDRLTRVSPTEGSDRFSWGVGTVRDVSPSGFGLILRCRIDPGTVLAVEPLGWETRRTLHARVVHTTRDGNGWLHGCELLEPLSEVELRDWLALVP